MKHALIIAYEFPPFVDSGVYRTVKFVKYLPRFGWRTTVLTVSINPKHQASTDHSLLDEVPAETRIEYARIIDPYSLYYLLGGRRLQGERASKHAPVRHGGQGQKRSLRTRATAAARNVYNGMMLPDAKIGWYPNAVKQGRRICQTDRPDVIFSTSPRETAHLIGRRLAALHKIPWVADFRDPWIGAFYAPKRPALIQKINRSLERAVVSGADAITVAWPGITERLQAAHPQIGHANFHTITNGFDDEDFATIKAMSFERFTIVHVGRFPERRAPEVFLRGIALLLQKTPELAAKLDVLFIGPRQDFVDAAVSRHGLDHQVQRPGRVTHREAIAIMKGADCLLFQNATMPGAKQSDQNEPFIAGKLFEYLGSRTPILAFLQADCVSTHLLTLGPENQLVTSNEATDAAAAVQQLMKHHPAAVNRASQDEPESYPDSFSDFQRRNLTARLAKVLESVLD